MARNTWLGRATARPAEVFVIPSVGIVGEVFKLYISGHVLTHKVVDSGSTDPKILATQLVKSWVNQFQTLQKLVPELQEYTVTESTYEGAYGLKIIGPRDGRSIRVGKAIEGPKLCEVTRLRAGSAEKSRTVSVKFVRPPTAGEYAAWFEDEPEDVHRLRFDQPLMTMLILNPRYQASLIVDTSKLVGIADCKITYTPTVEYSPMLLEITQPSRALDAVWYLKCHDRFSLALPVNADSTAVKKALENLPGMEGLIGEVKRTAVDKVQFEFLGEERPSLYVIPKDKSEGTLVPIIRERQAATKAYRTLMLDPNVVGGTYRLVIKAQPTSEIPWDAGWIKVSEAILAIDPGAVVGINEAGNLTIATTDDVPVLLDDSELIGGTPIIIDEPATEAVNEMQSIHLNGAAAGGFFLAFKEQVSPTFTVDSSAADIRQWLQKDVGDQVKVIGTLEDSVMVEFVGNLAAQPIDLIEVREDWLTLMNASTVNIITATRATNANDFYNPSNWSNGAVPVAGDSLVFEPGTEACVAESPIPCPAEIIVMRGFINQLKLAIGSPTDLDFSDSSTRILIGAGESGASPSRVSIDMGMHRMDCEVLCSVRAPVPGIVLSGFHPGNTVKVLDALVQLGDAQETSVFAKVMVQPTKPKIGEINVRIHPTTKVEILEVQSGLVDSGSVPKTLDCKAASVFVNGDGVIDKLSITDGNVQWRASGQLGKGKSIESISLDKNGDVVVKSTNHGLKDGSWVYLKNTGISWLDLSGMSIWVVSKDEFGLLCTAHEFVSYHGNGTWGLLNAVEIAGKGQLVMSGSKPRSIVAPILMHHKEAVLDDRDVTIDGLMVKFNMFSFYGTNQELHRFPVKG